MTANRVVANTVGIEFTSVKSGIYLREVLVHRGWNLNSLTANLQGTRKHEYEERRKETTS